MSRALLVAILLLVALSNLRAQPLGVGYYDLDGLYDTTEALFYNDTPYTPSGSKNWTQERYERKIDNTAAVIDSMALPIVGLYGVENVDVVRDIVRSSSLDYSSVHRTRNSLDGQDFALLYFGDKLFIDKVDTQRDMLVVEATLSDMSTTITIILSRNGRDTREYLRDNPRTNLVVILGAISQFEIDKMGYTNLLKSNEQSGHGNYCSYRGYMMHDRIATNKIEKILKSGIYITPWLLTPDKQRPLPTFDKSSYKGGYSKFLPIFTYINQ